MADIVKVAAAISADPALNGWERVSNYSPEFELRDLNARKVCIIPIGIDFKRVSRVQIDVSYHVELGFLFRNKELDTAKMITMMEKTVRPMLGKKYYDAICVGVAFEPLYDAEGLRTKSQFTSVVQLTLKAVEAWQ